MNHWLIVEPIGETSEPLWMVYSDDAILAEYWQTWMQQGTSYNIKHGLDEGTGINPLRCISDWVTVHWAIPATPESLINIISAPKPQLL